MSVRAALIAKTAIVSGPPARTKASADCAASMAKTATVIPRGTRPAAPDKSCAATPDARSRRPLPPIHVTPVSRPQRRRLPGTTQRMVDVWAAEAAGPGGAAWGGQLTMRA